MFEVNVLGLCMCTQQACQLMKSGNKKDAGHVVMINSVAGHEVDKVTFYFLDFYLNIDRNIKNT